MDFDKLFNYGAPLVMLVLLWLWWSKQGWPFIKDSIQSEKAARREEMKGILSALEAIRINLSSNTDVTITTLEEVRRGRLDAERERSREQGGRRGRIQ